MLPTPLLLRRGSPVSIFAIEDRQPRQQRRQSWSI